MLKVLYSFPHALGAPGIGTTAHEQVKGAAEAGLEVEVYCADAVKPLPRSVRVVRTLAVGSVRIPPRALGVHRARRFHDHQVARAVRHGRSLPDIIHCWPSACIATLQTAKAHSIVSVREVPNTHTAHAFAVVSAELERLGLRPDPRSPHKPNASKLARETAEYALTDYLFIPSDYSRDTFIDRGVPAHKLIMHQYGFDPGRFTTHGQRSAVGNGPRGLTVAFVGLGEPRKGLHIALNAWFRSGLHEEGKFIVCGGIQAHYARFLGKQLQHPSVELTGFVEDVPSLLARADLLVLPSLEEGSALVTYEAQAMGSVLLVSDAAGARCDHGITGLVHTAGDVTELTEPLLMVASNPELLAEMRTNTLKRYNELTWQAAARVMVDAYADMVARGSTTVEQ